MFCAKNIVGAKELISFCILFRKILTLNSFLSNNCEAHFVPIKKYKYLQILKMSLLISNLIFAINVKWSKSK